MLVQDIMKTDVITIHPSETIRLALLTVQEHRIRHLPVVDQGGLVGIVTDRDLRDASPSTLERERDERIMAQPISSIMTKEVLTAHPRDFVEEAALTLYEYNVGCLPVVRQNRIVGILTRKDILHTLVELMGVTKPSQRVEMTVPDQAGVLAEVTEVFRSHNMNVASVFTYTGEEPDSLHLVFRLETMDARDVVNELDAKGFRVVWPTKDPKDWD